MEGEASAGVILVGGISAKEEQFDDSFDFLIHLFLRVARHHGVMESGSSHITGIRHRIGTTATRTGKAGSWSYLTLVRLAEG